MIIAVGLPAAFFIANKKGEQLQCRSPFSVI
jgi:hypothetical protein